VQIYVVFGSNFGANAHLQRHFQAISFAMNIAGKANHSPQNNTQKPLKSSITAPTDTSKLNY
jgi:hypothetical protein